MGNGLFKDCKLGEIAGGIGKTQEPHESIESIETSCDTIQRTSPNLYPDRIHGNPPSNIPDAIDEACDVIHKAAKGWGTDETTLIRELASRPSSERYEIWTRYRQLNESKNLEDLIRSECGSKDMGLALQLLAMPPDAADARLIHEATRGCGARGRYLYPVLCGRSNSEMALLREAYYSSYGEDLALRLNRELGGDGLIFGDGGFKEFLMRCLQGSEQSYDPEWHTEDRAERYARALFGAGQGRWGTNEIGVFKVVLQSSPPHLSNVDRVYREKYDKSILEALDSELGGLGETAAGYAAGMKLQPYRTVARQIRLACRGFGTDELMLTSLIVRYQGILKEVDEAHKEMYEGMSIAERVEKETGGLYQYLLLEVIKSAGVGEE